MSNQILSISSFKSFLLRLLLPYFVIISLVGFVFQLVFEKYIILSSDTCGAYKVNRILTHNDPDETPIFGSSRAEYGFVPDTLGKDCFNYGLTSSRYDVTTFFMEQECKKKKNKPWLIVNYDYESLMYDIGDISNYLYNFGNKDVRDLVGTNKKFYYSIPFIKYYGQYEVYFKYFLMKRNDILKITDKGASLFKTDLRPDEFKVLVEQRKKNPSIFAHDEGLKQKMLRIIKSNPQRQFIFVISPYHSSYFTIFEHYDDANKFLQELDAIPNVILIDYSKKYYPDSMYLNTTHLNYKGAYKFSRDIKDTLNKLGIQL